MTATKTKSRTAPKSTTAKTTQRKRQPKAVASVQPIMETHPQIQIPQDIPAATPFEPFARDREEFITETSRPDQSAVEEIVSGIANQISTDSTIDTACVYSGPADGKDEISRKILARIASLAAAEIDGLLPPRRDFRSRVGDLVKGRIDGIRVDVGTTEAAVDILTRVHYGADIPRLVSHLRENVARRIWQMTGLKVVEVNITVQDVATQP
jgi:uncharacterized alkaline shock family protein YloU